MQVIAAVETNEEGVASVTSVSVFVPIDEVDAVVATLTDAAAAVTFFSRGACAHCLAEVVMLVWMAQKIQERATTP